MSERMASAGDLADSLYANRYLDSLEADRCFRDALHELRRRCETADMWRERATSAEGLLEALRRDFNDLRRLLSDANSNLAIAIQDANETLKRDLDERMS